MKRAPTPRRRRERGAAAVEFALVSLVLVPILLGIIDYGLWFNDSLNARSGTREAARRAVVKTFPTTGACSTGTDMAKINCITKREVNSISGPTYVKVALPDTNWAKGRRLMVCAMVKVNGASGFVPIPNGRMIHVKTQMSIENGTPATGTVANGTDTAPAGANWNWCVA